MKGSKLERVWVGVLLIGVVFAGFNCRREEEPRPPLPPAPAPTPGAVVSEPGVIIALALPLAGEENTPGWSCLQGINLAVAARGTEAGVTQKELLVVKVKGDTPEAARQAARQVGVKNPHLIIGGVTELHAQALAEMAQQAGIPFIAIMAANDQLTAGDYVFRVHSPESDVGKVLARFAVENLNAQKVALLVQASPQSLVTARAFVAVLGDLGRAAATQVSFEESGEDIGGQLAMLVSKKPDAIFLAASPAEIAKRIKEIREAGIKAAVLAPYSGNLNQLLALSEEARQGCYFGSAFEPDATRAEVNEFVEDYKAIPSALQFPPAEAALAYDACLLALEAIKDAASSERSQLRDALAKVKDVPGVTGVFSIDPLGNPRKSIAIVELKGLRPELSARLTPLE